MNRKKLIILAAIVMILGIGLALRPEPTVVPPKPPVHVTVKPQPIPMSSMVKTVNYCQPNQPETTASKQHQQRIIDDVRAMTEYKGSQDDEVYKILQSNYAQDVAQYDTCELRDF